MRRLAGVVAAGLLIVLAGCTDGTPSPTGGSTDPGPGGSTSAATPSRHATAKSTTTKPVKVPGAECLRGTWRLVQFTSHGGWYDFGTGRGGDVTIAFDKGRYTVAGNGKKPMRVNRAGESADLWIDGKVKGTSAPDGKAMVFKIEAATGKATVEYGGARQALPMSSVAEMIAPTGTARLACSQKDGLAITLDSVRLKLKR